MENLTSFFVYFGAYLTVYLLIIALIVLAVFIGIRLRKNKSAGIEAASGDDRSKKETSGVHSA